MYINNETDKDFIKRLWESQVNDVKRMNSGKLTDTCFFGIFFDSLFEDINETFYFKQSDNTIDVCINDKEMPYWGPVASEDWAYGNASEKNKMKVEIIERIQLLRQLEEHRFAFWSYDGRVGSEYKHSSTAHIFSLGGNENADYMLRHFNETFIPTMSLKVFINNGFMDNDEQRNRKLLRRSNITMWVAVLTLVVAIVSMFISKNTKTSKYNERVGFENGQNESLQHLTILKTADENYQDHRQSCTPRLMCLYVAP